MKHRIAFSELSDDELREIISDAKAELLARLNKVKDEMASTTLALSHAEGFINGLLWPDRWEQRCPGGPWVFGNTKDDQQLSEKSNKAWRAGWEEGFSAKQSLNVRVSDALFNEGTQYRRDLTAYLRQFDTATPPSECEFTPGDTVRYQHSGTYDEATVAYTVNLPARDVTLYLIVIGGEHYSAAPHAVCLTKGSDLSYSLCKKKQL